MQFESLEGRLLLTTTYDGALKKITVTSTAGNDTITISKSAGGTYTVSNNGVTEYNSSQALLLITVDAGSGNDVINLGATSSPITIPATLVGYNGADTITGGAGNDSIEGGDSNDSIDGGLGADSVTGGAGNDTMSYATRATAVTVTLDNLINDGAAGENDRVGLANDVESVMGGSGNDIITGNTVGNYISGGSGNDVIHGMDNSDTIVGGAGVDSLYGDNDADYLFAVDGQIDVVDGGPGIDSASTDPGEASPLPEDPVQADIPLASNTFSVLTSSPTTTTSTVSGKAKSAPAVKSGLSFATRRITVSRPVSRPPARKVGPTKIVTSTKTNSATAGLLTTNTAGPVAGAPAGYEGGIDSANLDQILFPLDPYCKGQVLVTRNNQGVVNVTGTGSGDPFTAGNDVFVIQTVKGAAGVQIYNNGGFTEFLLPSNPILIDGVAGNDQLNVTGGNGTYTPGNGQSAGTVVSDGHTIVYNNLGGGGTNNAPAFSNFDTLTYVTPNANDAIQISALADGVGTFVSGTSGNQPLGAVRFDLVKLITLDLGQQDAAAGTSDSVVVDSLPAGAPSFAILPGTAGTDTLTVNGPGFGLANDPAPDPASAPTLALTVNANGAMHFDAATTHLAGFNLSGQAAISPSGDKVLFTRGLAITGNGRLDVTDNTVLVDYASNSGGAFANIRNWLVSGYQAAAPTHWNGLGIYSSVAAGDNSKSVGYARSLDYFASSGGSGSYRNVSLDDTAAIITFTVNADSNLDRKVDFSDLVNLAQNYDTASGATWLKGDFDFDGDCAFEDLVILAQNYDSHYP